MLRRVAVDAFLEVDTVAGTVVIVMGVMGPDDDAPVSLRRDDITSTLTAAKRHKLRNIFAEAVPKLPPSPTNPDLESDALTAASGDPAERRRQEEG